MRHALKPNFANLTKMFTKMKKVEIEIELEKTRLPSLYGAIMFWFTEVKIGHFFKLNLINYVFDHYYTDTPFAINKILIKLTFNF